MRNITRKVLILKNVDSEIIEQAFLILKDSAHEGDSKVIREAEKVVEKYMGKKRSDFGETKKKKKTAVMVVFAVAAGLGVVFLKFFA